MSPIYRTRGATCECGTTHSCTHAHPLISHWTHTTWAESPLTAVHIINISPSRPLVYKIPQELWSGKSPDYGKLRIFGCEAYALVPKDDRRKLESRSRKCIFIGYEPDGSFAYQLWDPETREVIRSGQCSRSSHAATLMYHRILLK